MIVCQVKKFELSSKAEDLMTAREYREASQWLTTWPIPNNIPIVVADTEAEAIAKPETVFVATSVLGKDFRELI